MTVVVSGSFAEFDPEEVIEKIDGHLKVIFDRRENDKSAWFEKMRKNGKKKGFWFFKKILPWPEEELKRIWKYGFNSDDNWYCGSPKYRIWDKWDETIKTFERLKAFCQLSTDAGNVTVHLSKEDALFAYNWNV